MHEQHAFTREAEAREVLAQAVNRAHKGGAFDNLSFAQRVILWVESLPRELIRGRA